MTYFKILLLTLLSAQTTLALEAYKCSDGNIEIKAKGFTGFGAEAQKVKSVGRLTPAFTSTSTYQRAFEIGRYRFVKESEWTVYRRNDRDVFELRSDIKFPVKVSVDQPIYVSRRDQNVLEIRRNTDDQNSTAITVVFGRTEIDVKDSSGNKILNYALCPPTSGRPATVIPKATKTTTGN